MDIVDLLNRLYCIMDFIAVRFNLYKGELYRVVCRHSVAVF
jgi:hypothetical protein